MKSKIIILITLLLLVMNNPLWARGNRGEGERGQRLKQELNLSDEQFTQLQTMKAAHREKTKAVHSEIKILREKIFTGLKSGSITDAEAEAIAQEIGQKHTSLTLEMVRHMREIKEILNDEQYQKLGDFMEKKKGKWKGHQKGRKGYHNNCPRNEE